MASEDLSAKLEQARRVLTQFAGVESVGFGYKERGGKTTDEVSFRVYVHEKKPRSELAPHEIVPPEFAGIQTDVLPVIYSDTFACQSLNYHSPLAGGTHLTDLKGWTLQGGGTIGVGTLGFFVSIDGESSRNRYAALTNHHVLAASAKGDTVYQPKFALNGNQVSIQRVEDEHPIGNVHDLGIRDNIDFTYDDGRDAGKYFVDAATAKIDTCYSSWCDTNFSIGLQNAILGLALPKSDQDATPTDAVAGFRRLMPEDVPPGNRPTVYKVGAETGRTVGRVAGVREEVTDSQTGFKKENCIVIDNTGPNCENGTRFADIGDSGSVVVNGKREIIGLLFGGDDNAGTGHACHIHPVLAKLKVTLISPSNTIRGSGSGTLLEAGATFKDDPLVAARAAALRRRILESERGRAYRRLVETHRDEVSYLINHVRPVTIAWHRAHGPGFLAHVLHASRYPDHPLPRELEGITREAALSRLREAFERHGSLALQADVEAHAEELRALLDGADDLESLAERLEETRTERPTGVP
jgi:hypothetical protein